MYVLLFQFIHLTQYKLLQSTKMERKKTTGAIGELLIFFLSDKPSNKKNFTKIKKDSKVLNKVFNITIHCD